MFERKENIIVLVGAVLSFISVFLPYVSVEFFGMSQSVKLLDGKDGYILMILVILTCVFLFLKNEKAFFIMDLSFAMRRSSVPPAYCVTEAESRRIR